MKRSLILLAISIGAATVSNADNATLDAAIGGGIGGAAGAAIGNEVGGRQGAVAGSALGAAVGTAIATDSELGYKSQPHAPEYKYAPSTGGHPHTHFCPPGQAKKGRC